MVVLGAPPSFALSDHAQAVLGQKPFLGISGDQFVDVATEWLDDAKKAILNGSVIGKKARIEKGVVLKDCEVQDEKIVPEGTDAKNEKMLVGGLEDGDDGMDMQDEGGEDDDF